MWQWHRQLKVFHLNLNFVQWFGTIQGSKGIDLTLRETVMLLMSRISPPLPKTWPVHHVCQTSAVGGQLLCTPYYHHHCVTCYVTCYVTLPSLWQCTSYLHRDNVPSPDVHPTITMTMYILPSPWQCTPYHHQIHPTVTIWAMYTLPSPPNVQCTPDLWQCTPYHHHLWERPIGPLFPNGASFPGS